MGKARWVGKKTGRNPTDRGKLGTKRSLLTDGRGVPLGFALAGANRNDHKLMRETLEAIPVLRPKPTPEEPQGLCLDKGYDYDEPRTLAAGVRLHAAPADQRRGGPGQARGRHQGKALGGRAHPFLAQPLPPHPDPLGEAPDTYLAMLTSRWHSSPGAARASRSRSRSSGSVQPWSGS